jgi:hypothetical protein
MDFEFGEYIEFYEGWPGFNNVVAAITARLPGIDPDWLQKVVRLGVGEGAIEVWRRQNQGNVAERAESKRSFGC